jgi:DNA (cytosine-5)-methyltransferase 1
VWSSEIEPFPLKVTAARFPGMQQLGSVTDIDGGAVEPVGIISFGSPCQDLSVAGKQLGIHEGQRSNLFFEAVRIIKEMRKADEARGRTGKSIRPRFAVWENVPGAFSSNKGADFKAVLEALAGVIEADVSIPQPKRWDTGGGIVGNGWSLAWRVYDAQYWGVPQRRKRIYLVADFAGERAGEILFEREGVRGDSPQGGEAGEGTAADAERGAGGSGGVRCLNPWDSESKRLFDVGGAMHTLYAHDNSGGHFNGVCYAIQGNMVDRDTNQNGPGYMVDDCPTLNTVDKHAVCYPETARTLAARHDSSPCVDRGQNVVAYTAKRFSEYGEGCGTLRANGGDVGGGTESIIVERV